MVKPGTLLLGAALTALAALPGCGNEAAPAKRPGAGAGAAVPVAVEQARMETVPVRLRVIGNVEPFTTVSLKARIDGQIVAVNFLEGKEVRKGEVLFRIDPRPFEAALRQTEANVLRDGAARDQARSQERRYQELLEKNFVSKEAYAQIRTNAEIAEANAKASQAALENARLNLEYCTIHSPIDGYPGKVLLQVGNLVKANDTGALLVLNQVKPIYVIFAVPEQALNSIRGYMGAGPLAVEASPPGVNAATDKPAAVGTLVFVDNAVDQSTGTIKLRAQFDNADRALWPGQFVNVSLRLFDEKDVILVPSRSVQTGPNGQFVFVVKPDMTAEVRPVSVTRTDGENSIIAKGVAKGEKVVVRGALRLAPGTKVQVRDPAEAS